MLRQVMKPILISVRKFVNILIGKETIGICMDLYSIKEIYP